MKYSWKVQEKSVANGRKRCRVEQLVTGTRGRPEIGTGEIGCVGIGSIGIGCIGIGSMEIAEHGNCRAYPRFGNLATSEQGEQVKYLTVSPNPA